MENKFKEYLKKHIKIKKRLDSLDIFIDFNGYHGSFIYTEENLNKYINYLKEVFKKNKQETIRCYTEKSLYPHPTIYTAGDLDNIGYIGNWLSVHNIPLILYRLYIGRKIQKNLIEDFIKSNKDYFNVIDYKELFFVRSIVGEKKVTNTRKRKEK